MFAKLGKVMAVAAVLLGASGCASFMCCDRIELPENAVLLDVRTAEDFNKCHIEGAVLIPHDKIEAGIGSVAPVKTTPIFVYCLSGRRAGIAIEKMKKMGYTDLTNLGGIADAKKKLK